GRGVVQQDRVAEGRAAIFDLLTAMQATFTRLETLRIPVIAAKPPVAIWGTKQALHYARDHSVDDALKQMGWLQGAIWSNAHVREAITAMKDKRAGEFPGLVPLRSFREM
ncbi:MAG: hypothetical protein EOO22_24150, partial [Comamonadaceae bacterium]